VREKDIERRREREKELFNDLPLCACLAFSVEKRGRDKKRARERDRQRAKHFFNGFDSPGLCASLPAGILFQLNLGHSQVCFK